MHTSGSHGVEQFGLAILGWRDLYETRQPYSLRGLPTIGVVVTIHPIYMGLNQISIAVMIENHRTGLV